MKTKVPLVALSLSVLLCITGCTTGPKYNPFRVLQATIRATVKTIAIYHPKNDNPVEIQFERWIENELTNGGFATIGPDRINPIANREAQSIGGFYDPQTGAEDKSKSQLFWRSFLPCGWVAL